jgi:GH25 family lysozyme M1 (1,4-beta-N-acetylmuramidase)
VGSNGYGRWWLDVEVDNTWGHSRAGIAANKAVIRGALHYLRRRPHTTVGIYTETSWWQIITADSRRFAGTPVWGGGANSRHNARRNCRKHSITGARAVLAQWIVGSVDHDLAC